MRIAILIGGCALFGLLTSLRSTADGMLLRAVIAGVAFAILGVTTALTLKQAKK
jgi:hypothetical protein